MRLCIYDLCVTNWPLEETEYFLNISLKSSCDICKTKLDRTKLVCSHYNHWSCLYTGKAMLNDSSLYHPDIRPHCSASRSSSDSLDITTLVMREYINGMLQALWRIQRTKSSQSELYHLRDSLKQQDMHTHTKLWWTVMSTDSTVTGLLSRSRESFHNSGRTVLMLQ